MATFPASVVTAAAALGVDVSSLGQQECELLKQILAASAAIAGGGGGGGAPSGPAGGVLGGTYPNPSFGFTGLTITAGVLSAAVITGADDTTALSIMGGNITGSGTTPFEIKEGTWNTTGSPTAVLVNITKTAVGSAYKLVDWQFGGTTWLSITRAASNDEPALLTSGTQAIQIGNANGALRIITDGGGNAFVQTSNSSGLTFSGLFGAATSNITFNGTTYNLSGLTQNGLLVTSGGNGELSVVNNGADYNGPISASLGGNITIVNGIVTNFSEAL